MDNKETSLEPELTLENILRNELTLEKILKLQRIEEAEGKEIPSPKRKARRPSMDEKCGLCQLPSVDEREFEAGNNAEYSVFMPLCETHSDECERNEIDFEEKYAEQILARLEDRYV